MGATTAEVTQRQADVGRLYVIDHPFAGLDLRNWPRWARRWRAEFEGVPSCAISAGPG
jgi:hypothetical protein